MTQPEIARFLRKQRAERGLTMRQVAEELGVSVAQIGNAENPNDPSRISMRERVLRFYGFEMEAVFNVIPLEEAQ